MALAVLAVASTAATLVVAASPVAGQDTPAQGSDELASNDVPNGDQADDASVVPVPASGPGVSQRDAIVGPSGRRATGSGGVGGATTSAAVPVVGDATRLHVKIHDGTTSDDAGLRQLVAATPGATIEPLFGRPSDELAADRAEAEATSGEPQPDLSTWYLIASPSPSAGVGLLGALGDNPAVEMVQPEPVLAATAPIEEERQGYLDVAPGGVDAEWAWSEPAGSGSRVVVAIIDSGFDTTHPDADRATAPGVAIAHEPAWDPHHGLQVLGILVGDDDGAGVRGIASGAGIRTINSGTTSGQIANAIDLASAAVGAGDVISISQGICAVPSCADDVVLPLVYSSSARDALRLASARGVITVVSGGNGGANLDNYGSRLGADAPDTIVVGAGNPAAGACSAGESPARGRVGFSNYGSRVDLQGWGACVRTAAQGGGYRWWGFTSAATPIVAGAAALVSSLAEEQRGVNLTGDQVRSLLRETGSSQVFAGARGGNIGPLPNVQAAMASLERIPANDMWGRARQVSDLPFATAIDSRWAGLELAEPAVLCGGLSHSVWYRYQPSEDIDVTINTRGSDHDTMLGLWRRTGSSLERVSCDDDINDRNTRSEITRRLIAGQDYYIQVGGAGGRSGNLRLNITSPARPDVGCDIDNDDRGDLLTGNPREDVDGRRNAGEALLFFGRKRVRPAKVTSITQEWPRVRGASERGDLFAAAVACGDFDGDGFDDIAIGGPGEGIGDNSKVGAVRVLRGSRDGVSETGVLTLTQGTPGVRGKNRQNDQFGNALAVGDVNGDGYDDLVVGVVGKRVKGQPGSGAVQIFHGTAAGLSPATETLINGNSDGLPNRAERDDAFGAALTTGDFDGDGFDDVAIAAPGEGIGGAAAAGAVFVLRGSPVGVTTRGSIALHQRRPGVTGRPHAGDQFGASVAAGDVNGDGFDDLLVGVPGEGFAGAARAGRVHEFLGGNGGLDPERSRALRQDVGGNPLRVEAEDRFGAAIAVADITGDGIADAAIASPGESLGAATGAGQVLVLDGSRSGLADIGYQWVHQAKDGIDGEPEIDDGFGTSLTLVDLNGDGRRDLAIGIPGENAAGGADDTGAVVIVPGGRRGVRRAASASLSQVSPPASDNAPGDRFGTALAAS